MAEEDISLIEWLHHDVEKTAAEYEKLPEAYQPRWYVRSKQCLKTTRVGPYYDYECTEPKGHEGDHSHNIDQRTKIVWTTKY